MYEGGSHDIQVGTGWTRAGQDVMAANDSNRDKEMAKHLREAGYPHGRRMTSPSPMSVFKKDQVGSNNYVRYLKSRFDKRIK